MLNTTLITLTRDEIENAIRNHPQWSDDVDAPVVGDMRDQYDGYEGLDFEANVDAVCQALTDGPLAATHEVYMNFTWESGEGTTSGGQVEVSLPQGGYIAADWYQLKHLTRDRSATGIEGLVAIAEALIDHANESLRLAWSMMPSGHVFGKNLDPLPPAHGTEEYTLTWEINMDGSSPADAAARVWREVFHRAPWQPNDDEACVFRVTGPLGSTQIDLSEENFAHLFSQTGS